MASDSHTKSKQFFQNLFLAGTISAFSKTLIAPLENAIQHANLRNQNATSYLTNTVKAGGILALWRFNVTKIKRSSPHQAFNFAFYDLFKKTFCSSFERKMELWKFLLSHMAAGAAAGAITLLMLFPIGLSNERKIQLATDYGKSTDFTKDGFLRLYKGFGISVFGVMAYRSLYFGGYETAKKLMFPQWEEKSFVEKYLVALGTTIFAVLVSYPVDVVRRKMIFKSESFHYKIALDCAKKIYHEEGLKEFVKGIRLSFVFGIAGSLNLVLFDKFQMLLSEKNREI